MPATNAFPTYRISFRSPVRIGERGVGLEVSRARIPADTIFGAVCSAWRELYGADDLQQKLLAEFTANNGQPPPSLLTSAFPFAGAVRLFPRPFAASSATQGEGASYKLIARRGWVTSPEAGNLRRKTMWMLAEGSVLNGSMSQPHGRLVDAKPDPSPHPVWRYGYAFPMESFMSRTTP